MGFIYAKEDEGWLAKRKVSNQNHIPLEHRIRKKQF